jgi:FG-GAP repeat protein/VCBS repeat protein
MHPRTLGLAAVALAAGVVTQVAAAGGGGFVEPVRVIHTFEGTSPGATFGWAVSELADVDGDGIQEAVVGEPFTESGTTYVYSGRTGAPLYALPGRPGDQQGYAMADAGDTNGDGVHDLISGAPGDGAGHAYLYSGASGALLHTFTGVHDGEFFGAAVASAGDVDRDGRADLLVGAPRGKQGSGVSGRAYLFSGRTYELIRKLDVGKAADGFGTATDWTHDLDGDGVPDQLVGARNAGPERRGRAFAFSGRNGRLLFSIEASPTGEDLGWFFVAGVGDANGDGTPDVYAADFGDDANGRDSGRAGVYSGRDGSPLLTFVGSGADEGLGPGREAGDVNGDGRPDLAIGSWTSSDGAAVAGQIEIYSGADGSLLRRITSTTPFETLGFDTVGIGDVDGDGKPDLLAAAGNADRVYVLAGA